MFRKPLFQKSLRDHGRGIAGWVGGIVLIVVVQLSVYPTIRNSSEGWSTLTESFPKALQEMFRMTDYASERGYLTTELMSFMVPFIFIGLGCTWGARLTTEDEESGSADIALALPISRKTYVATRMLSLFSVLLVASILFFVSLAIGTRLLEMSIPLVHFIAAAVTLFVLSLLFSSFATAVGALSGRRPVALGVSMATAIGLFIIYSLTPLVDFFQPALKFNPFQWTLGADPIRNGLDAAYLVSTLCVSLALAAMTFWLYEQRDIAS